MHGKEAPRCGHWGASMTRPSPASQLWIGQAEGRTRVGSGARPDVQRVGRVRDRLRQQREGLPERRVVQHADVQVHARPHRRRRRLARDPLRAAAVARQARLRPARAPARRQRRTSGPPHWPVMRALSTPTPLLALRRVITWFCVPGSMRQTGGRASAQRVRISPG